MHDDLVANDHVVGDGPGRPLRHNYPNRLASPRSAATWPTTWPAKTRPARRCEACEGEREPGLLASVFGRFLNPSECDPHWCFTADAVALQRSSARSQPLFTGDATIAATRSVERARFELPEPRWGSNLDAVRRGPCGWEWELGYFQIDGWNANSTVPGDSVMVISSERHGFRRDRRRGPLPIRHPSGRNQSAKTMVRRVDPVGRLPRGRTERTLCTASGTDTAGSGQPEHQHVQPSLRIPDGRHLRVLQHGRPVAGQCLCKAGIYGNSAIQSSRQIDTGTSDDTLAASSQSGGVHRRGRRGGHLSGDLPSVVPRLLPGGVDRGRGLGARTDRRQRLHHAHRGSTPTAASSTTAADLARN